MTATDLRLLLNAVIPIAKQASDAIMNIYNNEDGFKVEYKGDNSPLTIADKTSNDIICQGLDSLRWQYPIISEENDEIAYQDRKDYEYCWVIDPLDGTKEFVKRNGEFAVNIALLHFQFPVLGVVAAPVQNGIAWAIKDQGAYYEKDGHTCKLACSTYSDTDTGLRIVKSRSHLSDDTVDYLTRFQEPQLIARGSSYKFLMIANGEADFYPRLGPTMEWDTAAPQILVEEAGGSLTRVDTGERMYYNKEDLLNPHFLTRAKRI